MRLRRRCAAVVLALAFGAPATAAHAQSSLQPAPPPSSTQPAAPSESSANRTQQPASNLPATGSESGILALAGMGLLLCGVGLRLRLREQGA